MSNFDAWIGRERNERDQLTQRHARQWCSTFDLEWPGDGVMPQGIHFALCTPEARTDCLGEDGHPARDAKEGGNPDGFLPPFPMPRRMWASSRIAFHAPIAIGAAIERTSRISSISEKEGRSGSLAFVDIEHRTSANGTLSVIETQTLVYRDAAAAEAPLSPPQAGNGHFDAGLWDVHRALVPDPRLLFRYSALTFNTHRIHYDAPYAHDIERYRGLVVHGPLIASLLLQLAASELGENALQRFEFRGASPAIAGEPLHLVMRASGAKDAGEYELAAFADDGRQVTKARAET